MITKRVQEAYDLIATDYAVRNAAMPPEVIEIDGPLRRVVRE